MFLNSMSSHLVHHEGNKGNPNYANTPYPSGSISPEMDLAHSNMSLQKEFAKNGIRWRVDDAKSAGIHPLYAIGANTASYSPVSAPSRQEGSDPIADLVFGLVNFMGQNILGSLLNTSTQSEREQTFAALKLQNAALENELLQAQVLNATAPPSMGPPLPTAGDYPLAGQTQSSIMVKPSETNATSRYNRATDAAAIPSIGWMRNDDGGYVPVQSALSKERTEDDLFATWDWNIRNRIVPTVKGISPPPSDVVRLKPGHYWNWNPFKQAFYQQKKMTRSAFDKLAVPMKQRIK